MLNLVHGCIKYNVGCLVNTGTSSEYGTCTKAMEENAPLNPNSIYGSSKASASIILRSMDKVPSVTLRLFSPFGFYEDRERLVPHVVLSFLRAQSPKLASGKSVRDFIFIDDVMKSYEKASDPDLGGNIFNIGTGKQHRVEEVVSAVKNCMGSDLEPVWNSAIPRKNEPSKWVADISKSKSILKWSPKYSLKEGVKKTVGWFNEKSYLYD